MFDLAMVLCLDNRDANCDDSNDDVGKKGCESVPSSGYSRKIVEQLSGCRCRYQ